MADPQAILLNALRHLSPSPQDVPSLTTTAEALQQVERDYKNPNFEYEQLLGTWQLCFVAKPRKGKPKSFGSQWIPAWVLIRITYTDQLLLESVALPQHSDQQRGSVHNQVQFGPLNLTLRGPTLFQGARSILAFDFTQLTIQVAGRTLYEGAIRGGPLQDRKFYSLSLKEQAFFRFFWVTAQGMAARGKGGGLALWARC